MARPVKQGLDYFPLDTDFLHQRIVRKIMKGCGPQSPLILICLLCNIYREDGYYIRWDEDLPFDTADIVGVSEGAVAEVIAKAVQVGFFDKVLFDKYGILTSADIQRRFKSATAKRAEIQIDYDYWVIDGKNPVNDGKLPEQTELLTPESTRKESKVKEIESKVNDTLSGESVVRAQEKKTIQGPSKKETSPPAPPRYVKFVQWQKENASRVLKMKEPITETQFEALLKEHSSKDICLMLQKMNNYNPLLQKNRSAYRTLNNWFEREISLGSKTARADKEIPENGNYKTTL